MPRSTARQPGFLRTPRGGIVPFALTLGAAAVLLFAALAGYMRSLERQAVESPAIRDQLTRNGTPRPLAEVTRAIRDLKLVTVEIGASVSSETTNQSWRGDITAKVEAPVRLLYGADLSKLTVDRLAFSPASGYFVRIPVPERIATEVCGDAEAVNVQVGWLRLRSRAGEYYLGLARRGLYERARELALSPEDARLVRESTRAQTESLIRKIVGPATPVTVAFQDSEP